MASEEQAVQLLNDAKLETDGNSKVDKLKGLYELVVNKQPALLEEFVPEVVELQVDPSPAVRKYLPEFLSGAAQALPTAGVLQQCIQCTAHLLSDEVAAAAKQAVLTSNLLFRTALSLVAAQGGDVQQAPALRALWEAAQGLKAAAVSMAAQHKNDGVRLNAAKFLEQAALLLTADSLPAVRGVFQGPIALQAGNQVVTKSVLVKDGEGLLTQLVALLKLRFGEDVSGPVAIVLVKGAGTVAQQRPQFLGKLLPALLALANSGKYKVDAAEGGMQSSIANALKQALVGVLRSTDPKAVIWRKKVVDAMGAMGAAALAEATLKQASRGNKRGGSEEPEASKRPRVAAAAAAQSQQQQQPAVQAQALPPQPQAAGQQAVQQPGQGLVAVPPSLQAAGWQQQQQQQVPQVVPTGTPPLRAAVGMGAEVALPPPTSQQDLDRVLTVLRALVAKGDANTLAAIVSGLQPAVLADVVLALAPTLPPRHVLPPDHLSLHPWVLQLLQLLAPQTQLMPLPAALPQQAPPFMQAIQPQPHQQAAFSGLQQAQPLQPQQQLPTLPAQPAQLQPLVQQPSGGMAGVAGQQASQLQPSVPAAPPSVQGAPPQAGQSLAASRPVLLDQQQQQPRQPTPPPPPPPRRQPLPQPQPQQSAAATAAARGPTPPPAAKPQPPRAAPAPAFRLAPLPLTAQQQADLRKAAVLRILSSRQVASPGLQRALVAKLAASAGDGEELGDAVLQFLLEDFAGRGGFELCMLWLDALFAAACKPLGAAGQAARPGPGQGAASLAEFVNSGLESFGLEEFLGIKSEQEQQQPGSNSSLDAAGTTGASGSGAGCGPSSNGGSSKYEVVLMALLEGLREALPPSDKTIVRLLLEVPSLPMPAVRQFLRELCGSGPDWATLALLAARDLIDQRPPSRQQMLAFVLESAGDANPDVRSKAVRLTANRLFPQPAITAAIERHARQQLDSMVVARRQLTSRPGSAGAPAPAQSSAAEPAALAAAADDVAEGKTPPEGAVAAAVDGTEAGAAVGRESQASEHAAAPDKEGDSDQQAAQAEGTRSGGPETFAGGEQPRPQEQQAVPSRGAGVAAADVSSSKATPPESEGGAPIAGAATGAAVGMGAGGAGPDEARAAQLCALYCALCTKKHSLLRHLFEVYGQTSDGGRAAIHKNAPGLAKTLGATAAALLAIVQDPPEGSLNLAINMLYVLTEATLPPPALVAAGRQLFERCRDARVLPPLVAGMDKAAVLRLLPALLDLAPEAGFKVAVQRLVTPQQRPAAAPGAAGSAAAAAEPPLFAPSELLAALHQLDHASSPGLLRKMMAGVTACLALRELFGREALAAAIGQMLTRAPLPHLFMRTVIQSLGAAPSLRPFVVSTLGQLVGRQIYNDAVQWRGWVMAAQQTAPDSFPAWLQLPPAVLGQALQGVPVAFRQQLAAFATSPKCTQSVPRLTLEVLQQHMLAPPEGQQQGSS